MVTKSASQILEGLYHRFTRVYQSWDEKHSMALARKMLEQDVILLGLYFGTVDEFGQLTELALVAECIAYIRIFDSAVDRRNVIDYWTDIVMEELYEHHLSKPQHSQTMADIVEQLDTWSLTKQLYTHGNISKDTITHVKHSFIELADVFFMRDGHITNEEMIAMREFEHALAIA